MLSYNDLEQEVDRLRRENASLKAELSELRSRYGVEDTPKESTIETVLVEQSEGINKYSTPDEKIALFRSLFVGRTDVFARRWYSKSSEKSGYQPVKLCTLSGKDDNLTVINSDNYSDNRQ